MKRSTSFLENPKVFSAAALKYSIYASELITTQASNKESNIAISLSSKIVTEVSLFALRPPERLLDEPELEFEVEAFSELLLCNVILRVPSLAVAIAVLNCLSLAILIRSPK